jgi:hypothetical protein
MKIKPDPALIRASNLSNEIQKRVTKSRETIPLSPGNKLKVKGNSQSILSYAVFNSTHIQLTNAHIPIQGFAYSMLKLQ